MNQRQRQLPTTLWHYTDAAGLKGIIESGKLRATHLAFLNDASEYLHAVSLLLDNVRGEKAKKTSSLRKLVLDELENFLAPTQPEHIVPIFVTCFSAKMNSLNQWRAYGKGEGGYSIGFDARRLRDSVVQNGILLGVIYDREEQAALVKGLLTWALNEFDRLAASDSKLAEENARKLWWNWFLVCAATAAPMLKSPAFHEEDEWRFIHLVTSPNDMEFSPRSTGLSPYINVTHKIIRSNGAVEADLLPITNLWSGPGRVTGISLAAGRVLLEKHGYFGVNLDISKIPFRVG